MEESLGHLVKATFNCHGIRQVSKMSLNIFIPHTSYPSKSRYKHYASKGSFAVSSHKSVWMETINDELIHVYSSES